MADKYCDHGLYGAASFTASRTTTSLNVTAIGSGRLAIGSLIFGNGIQDNSFISGYGTGRGGTGTYTTSSTGTLASGAMTAIQGNISLDPAWGVAQEGDGTVISASTPATISVDMSTWIFTLGSSTFSVMGATAITITAGANSATNAQYSATYATMLANIVAAINLATATAANVPSGWRTNVQTRDQVFARANGNNFELMTRAGSASWNGLVAVTFTNVTGSSSQSWASGSGGAWGSLCNLNGTTFPSAIAAAGYGLWCATLPIAGSIDPGDLIHIRSAKTLPMFTNGVVVAMAAIGSASSYAEMRIDASVKWSDGADPILLFELRNGAAGTLVFSYVNGATSFVNIVAPSRPADDYYGLVLDSTTHGGTGTAQVLLSSRGIEGVHVKQHAAGIQPPFSLNNAAAVMNYKNLKATLNRNTNGLVYSSNSGSGKISIKGFVVDNGAYGFVNTGVLSFGAFIQALEVEIAGLSMLNFVNGSSLMAGATTTKRITLTDVDLGGVTSYGAKIADIAGASTASTNEYCSISSARDNKTFALDTRQGFCEWNPARTFPTLNAVLESGTAWSLRAIPTSVSANIGAFLPLAIPRIIKRNSLTSGARTFTVEFCVKAGVTVTKASAFLEVSYIDTTGVVRQITSQVLQGGALDSSTALWSVRDGSNNPTFDDSGVITFTRYKISLSTLVGFNLAQDTDVTAVFNLAYLPSDVTEMAFIDPDITIV